MNDAICFFNELEYLFLAKSVKVVQHYQGKQIPQHISHTLVRKNTTLGHCSISYKQLLYKIGAFRSE